MNTNLELNDFNLEEFINTDNRKIVNFEIQLLRKQEMFTMDIINGSLEMSGFKKYLGKSYIELKPAAIHLNNKISELSKKFNELGISLYDSFVGDVIIKILMDKYSISAKKMIEYGETIREVSLQRHNRLGKSLMTFPGVFFGTPIWKILLRIFRVQPVNFSLTEEERNKLDKALREYKDSDSDIINYQLEDNIIVDALVKEIAFPKIGEDIIAHNTFVIRDPYQADKVPVLLEERIIPELKKLGLEHLISKLQSELISAYKKALPNSKINPEDMYRYVPDFSRESKESKQQTGAVLEMESFEEVDSRVSPVQRQDAIEAIRKEIKSSQILDEANQSPIKKVEEFMKQ